MHSFDIDLSNISKIEGHTNLHIHVYKGRVTECKLGISENQRFFKRAIEGLEYGQVPTTMSRICGTCSSAHNLCSIEAIEKAFGVKISEQSLKLRKLMMYGSHIRDHAMHLYFFCLPDVFGKESVFDFKDDLHKWVHYGLDVKEAGNFLATITGGRAVHAIYSTIGGFTNFPTKGQMKEAIGKLEAVRQKVIDVIDIFYEDKRTFKRETNYVGLINYDYSFLEGEIKTAKGTIIPENKFREHLEEVILPYSTASGFTWESKDFMVGALARMNLNKGNLNKRTRKDCEKYLKIFPNDCVFNNNTAQAIEVLHGIDSSIDILQDLMKTLRKEDPVESHPRESVGVGVVEAPRGTLYYKIELGADGKVKKADLVIPTQQNIIHLEKDIAKYVEQLLAEGTDKEAISLKVEEMIRAYDPCMSCATHFLKIKWDWE
jgi:coenzyme F420-reducing hydrogenase alpha subunit